MKQIYKAYLPSGILVLYSIVTGPVHSLYRFLSYLPLYHWTILIIVLPAILLFAETRKPHKRGTTDDVPQYIALFVAASIILLIVTYPLFPLLDVPFIAGRTTVTIDVLDD